MSVFHENMLIGSSGQGGAAAAYQIERSLRFNSADSASLSRTPASAGNRRTWTWAAWVKRSDVSTARNMLFSAGTNPSGADLFTIEFSSNQVRIADGGSTPFFTSTALYRDPSAWLHLLIAVDTTQATAANRLRIYVNGSEIIGTFSYPSQNYDTQVNNTSIHYIGRWSGGLYLSGYLAECHFINGQALTPSSFGEFDTNNVWQPIEYTGSYGTNGFYLDFADNSAATAATLGKDTSGNGNNWTPNNLSVTAGAGNDSLVDSPTNYGTDTGAGGEVRGNYCTINPVLPYTGITLSNGNLTSVGTADYRTIIGTMGVSSGKWYWEITAGFAGGPSVDCHVGLCTGNFGAVIGGYGGQSSSGWSYSGYSGFKYHNATGATYGASFSTNDIIGVAFDADAGSLVFYKNGVSQGTAYTGLTSGPYFPTVTQGNTNTIQANFGQRPFAYTAPSGFKALCTQNLPTPTITKPSTVMDVALWTGNGSARSITGLGFNPDLVWIKGRSGATDHALYDSVRGAEKRLESNTTDAEVTSDGGVTAFNSDGFSLGTLAQVNTNTATYAGWTWDAGSSTVTNTAGTISSQVRANTSAGFSVLTYTGAGSGTIGHGLGVAPAFIIVKKRSASDEWTVYHSTLGASNYLWLHATNASQSNTNRWGGTAPTSTVFSVGNSSAVSTSGATFVGYAWAPVAGYSAFGSYTGNGSADGPFVFCGFRPAVVLVKMSSSTGNWTMLDYQREGYNVDNDPLYPNLGNAEGTTDLIDITSNGFKVRSTDASFNTNAGTYVYAAWAQSPFALARAR